MDVSEYNGDCIKRGYTDSFDSRRGDGDKSEDEDEGSDKKKHRSSKSRRHGNELEDLENGSRRRASDECGDGKRKSSIRTDSFDKDDYDPRKEIRSKMTIKDFGSNDQGNHSSDRDKRDKSEKKLTSGYLVDYPENHRDDGSDDGGRLEEDFRSRSRGDNGSLNEGGRQAVVKGSSQDLSYTDGKSMQEQYTESIIDKKPQKGIKHEVEDSRYTDQKDTGNNQPQGTSFDKHIKEESYRRSRRKWDEPDFTEKATHGTEDDYGDRIDSRGNRLQDKPVSTRERTTDARETSLSSRTSHFESNQNQGDDQKSTRASNKEEKFADPERNKSRGRWDVREEDHDGYKLIPESQEYKYGNSRDDRHNRPREAIGSLENSENRSIHRMQSEMHAERKDSTPNRKDDKLVNLEEDGLSGRRLQDRRDDLDDSDRGRSASRSKSGRTFESSRRSKSPERRRYRQGSEEHERGNSDERAGSDNERSSSLKGRDREFKEERSKSRDQGYNSRGREWDGSADNWSRKHHKRYDRDMKDVEAERSHDKEWDTKRRDKERMDNENVPGRSSRSDRTRQDGIRAFSNYAVDENSDSFAIRRTHAEFGKEPGPAYSGKRIESGIDFGSKMAEEDWGYSAGDKTRSVDLYTVGDEKQDKFTDEGPSAIDQSIGLSSGRADCDSHTGRGRVHKGPTNAIHVSTSDSVNGSQVPFENSQGFPPNRMIQQGSKVGRPGRGGRARTTPSRDMQRVGIPGPIMGHPFGPMGMPPGPMQPMGPNIPPSPGPHMAPGMFMLPTGPLLWPGPRGVDMNMLAVPAGMPHIPPPGPAGPRFPPNIGAFPNHPANFNQPGPVRGVFANISAPGFSGVNGMAPPLGRGVNDKAASSWVPPRNSGSSGKAPSRGEQNDYSQNFVDTGMRPQNFIRELELTNVVEDYPKLRELIQKKDEIVANSNCPPMYHKCDLKEFVLNHEFFGSKFDVILVDPPWEEYVHRAPGIGDHMECWNFEEIQNLKIEAIADTPSFIFLWVGDGMGLEQGRLCLKKWGFRRCEDICWVKTNKGNATPGLRHDSHTLFQHSKEHCLMGIKGTVRRSTDGHIIHANIDTDIIIAEEPPYGSTAKPEDLYRIVEHFALGRRRIELFGEDHNIRPGWLTVGKGLTSSNFNRETYCKNFADKDGKVWLGGGGRNPPPDAPHLVLTTPDIESLRPKSPPAKNQQQGSSVSQPTANSSSKRPANSPAHPNQIVLTPSPPQSIGIMPEPPNLNFQGGVQWSPMGMKPPIDSNHPTMEDKSFDNYGCNVQTISENVEFESHRTLNML